jgi:hypothetical protein
MGGMGWESEEREKRRNESRRSMGEIEPCGNPILCGGKNLTSGLPTTEYMDSDGRENSPHRSQVEGLIRIETVDSVANELKTKSKKK